MKTEEFYVVYKPTFDSEKRDIFSAEPTSLQSLYNQFHGGLKPEMIHAIFTKKSEAEKEADALYKIQLSKRKEDDPFSFPVKERFKRFAVAFGELSTKYGIAVHSTGGVTILETKQEVRYSKDHTSGDLQVYI